MMSNVMQDGYLRVTTGTGKHKLELSGFDTGEGVVAYLIGGELPHVGGVVLATPRLSISGSGDTSCDIYSIPVTGHLDNELGAHVAKELCRNLQVPISITSGIHVDNATENDLRLILENGHTIVQHFLKLLQQE